MDAKKVKIGREEAIALARSVERVVVGKPKSTVLFEMKKNPPDEDTLAAHLLGPTGNLKAPTMRIGDTLLVGFSESAYQLVFGES